jgi:hypothetical protein
MSKRRSIQRQPEQAWLRQRASPTSVVLIAAGLLLLAAVVWSAWPRPAAAPEVRGAPRLKVDRDRVDLGRVKLGSWVEVKYQLTNSGDQPLRLTQAPYVEVVEGC